MTSDPLSLPLWAYELWMRRANSPPPPLSIERTTDGELFAVREVIPAQPAVTLRVWQREVGESEAAFLHRLMVNMLAFARLIEHDGA